MNRIEARFQALKAKGVSAFIPYITAGDPGMEQSAQLVLALEHAGADVIEFGVPFSDPVGDGIVIQEAAQRALQRGASLRKVIASVRAIRRQSQVPLLLFSYFNPILAYGVESFARDAADAGVDGVLCVDLPPDEADDYKLALDKAGLCTVFLTAPTSSDDRLRLIGAKCSGFVYYVSRLGVTGEKTDLAEGLKAAVARIQRLTGKPVAVGFGISTPEQAAAVAGLAEGVVVGSAIVRVIAQHGEDPALFEIVEAFAKGLASAVKNTT
jgi:tryptophan synthase alpha chain